MSRAYRIKVSESINRTIRGEDNVSTHLEILNVLPPEEMGALLKQELLKRGFEERENGQLVREQNGVEVVVDPIEGTVTVQVAGCQEVEVEGALEGFAPAAEGQHARTAKENLKKQLQGQLEKQVEEKQAKLQEQLTDELERQLADLKKELDQVANTVTAQALKKKAAQMGRIKEVSEDPQNGSMTIVLEV